MTQAGSLTWSVFSNCRTGPGTPPSHAGIPRPGPDGKGDDVVKVPDTDDVVSPTDEWLARVSPFLPADEPHQQCIGRARAAGSYTVNAFCDCPAAPCTKSCCVPPEEDW